MRGRRPARPWPSVTRTPPEDERSAIRFGIDRGDIIIEGDDIHGGGVNVAARLEAIAEPGGVRFSGSVHDRGRGKAAWFLQTVAWWSAPRISRNRRNVMVEISLHRSPKTSHTKCTPTRKIFAPLGP